jgi:predicted GNAT family acetyltransferase
VIDSYEIRNDPKKQRFSIDVGENEVAVLDYTRSDGVIVLTHTGVPSAFEHHGIAGQLARAALEYAKAEGLKVVPRCSFVRAYLQKHPEYAPLVVAP